MKDLKPNDSVSSNLSWKPFALLAAGVVGGVIVTSAWVRPTEKPVVRPVSVAPVATLDRHAPKSADIEPPRKPKMAPGGKLFLAIANRLKSEGVKIMEIREPYQHEGRWAQQVEYETDSAYYNVAFYMDGDRIGEVNVRSETELEKPPYVVDGLKWQSDGVFAYIVGTVRNQTSKRWSYVQVQINVIDKNGDVVGSTMANATNIEPGQRWKFKTLATEAKAGSTFRLGDVTYY